MRNKKWLRLLAQVTGSGEAAIKIRLSDPERATLADSKPDTILA